MTGAQLHDVHVGDVLVIGAGVTGTLTAMHLVHAGYSVMLVDQRGFAAEQSGHSHGYLHRGYIYRSGEERLISHLTAGADAWRQLLDSFGCDPINEEAYIWNSVGLPVVREDYPPAGLRAHQLDAVFRSREATYDFTAFFDAVASRQAAGVTLKAQVARLTSHRGQVTGAIVHADGHKLRLVAGAVVLAAGAGNARIAETAVRFRGRSMVRSSLMVVMAHSRLPALSAVMPGNETHGLFLVSRQRRSDTVWLVSNFVSFAGARPDTTLTDLWLSGLVEKLGSFCTGVREPDVLWGVYEAPKAELRSQPGVVEAHAMERYGTSNMFVLAPTKLTLAPLLAAEAAAGVADAIGDPGPQRHEADSLGSPLTVCEERWRSVRLRSRDRFFGTPGREQARSVLARQPAAAPF